MLLHPNNPAYFLIELSDLKQPTLEPRVARHERAVRQIIEWSENFLCKPHPEVGRRGPVCPFVQPSMQQHLYFLSVQEGHDLSPDAMRHLVMDYRDWFLALEPRTSRAAQYKTILILFPDLPWEKVPSLIDDIQAELKPQYVENGIMVGEFHPGPPNKGGLWNPDFRPLYAPVPMLAIRNMVATDFLFLKDDKQLVLAYLERFTDSVPAAMQAMVLESALRFNIPLPIEATKLLTV